MQTARPLFTIFSQFLVLGLISFGGPAAHIGYFQKAFVDRLAWISQQQYAQLVSLSQLLPGPGSSQVGFAIGVHQAGLMGGLAAFAGFTLPSFLLMWLLAVSINFAEPNWWIAGLVDGLKLLAVVVVFDAVLTMFKSFCQTRLTISIALISALLLILFPTPLMQVMVIVIGALAAFLVKVDPVKQQYSHSDSEQSSFSVRFLVWPLSIFCGLFLLSFVPFSYSLIELFANFYQSGSLVFGGGHVVLPLLQSNVAAGMTNDTFLFGYAAAQGVPGPMFSIATFLGAGLVPSKPLVGAAIATLAIFLPGLLLMYAFSQSWLALTNNSFFSRLGLGINAAVVGLLMAAFYQPVWQSGVLNLVDFAFVVLGIICVRFLNWHILWLIWFFCAVGVGTAAFI